MNQPNQQQTSDNNQQNKPEIKAEAVKAAKTANLLYKIALLAALVSIFIGGVLLSTAALVVAIISKNKCKQAIVSCGIATKELIDLNKLTKTAIIMCVVALVMNAVSMIILLIMFMNQGGGFSILGLSESGPAAISSGMKTWG